MNTASIAVQSTEASIVFSSPDSHDSEAACPDLSANSKRDEVSSRNQVCAPRFGRQELPVCVLN